MTLHSRCAVGIDLGGTNIVAGLVDGGGHVIALVRRPTPVAAGPAGVLSAMRAMVQELLPRAGGRAVLGIGIGLPGLLDPERGVALMLPNLGWRHVPVRDEFAGLGLPVRIEGDVRCHTLGELHFGAGRGVSDFALLTLGTGIGAGIVIGGRLFRGPGGFAGEIGHIPLQPDGPLCGCGKRGCFEALASGLAMGRRAREAGIADSARELFARAAAGDPQATALVDAVAYDLGRGISAYVNLMNPQRIVLGGGVTLAGNLLLEPVRHHAEMETMPGMRGTYDIVPAALGEHAGAVGAATLVPGLAATG